jgi:hypothetical protein
MSYIRPGSLARGLVCLCLLYGTASSRNVEATTLARAEEPHKDFEHGVLVSDESWREFNASSVAFGTGDAPSFVDEWCNMLHVTKETYRSVCYGDGSNSIGSMADSPAHAAPHRASFC